MSDPKWKLVPIEPTDEMLEAGREYGTYEAMLDGYTTMTVCTFDNPATMRRECWQDGRLICGYSFTLWHLKDWTLPAELFFFGANIGDWKTGQLWGDRTAMRINDSPQKG